MKHPKTWSAALAALSLAVPAIPAQADPAQAGPAQASPTQASPSQASPSAGRALSLYDAGDWAAAADAFRALLDERPDDAELAFNLALAEWRAARADAAEVAAEKAAALSHGELGPLRDGLLGNLRYDASRAAAEQDPARALELARQAREHYLRGALADRGRGELRRNFERAARWIDELEKKLEQQQQQDGDPQDGDGESKPPDDQQQGEQQQGEQQREPEQPPDGEQQQQQQQQDGEPPPGDSKPQEQPQSGSEDQAREPQPRPDQQPPATEPKPEAAQDPAEPKPPEPTPEHGASEDQAAAPESADNEESRQQDGEVPPAPGEIDLDKLLSPEQKKRLLDKLAEYEDLQQRLRAAARTQRPRVDKDW